MRIRWFAAAAVLTAATALSVTGCSTTYERRDPTGETFPTVTGTALDGTEVTFPDAGGDQPLLLLVGYDQDAQFDIDRWMLALTQAEVRVRFYEVPTIPGLFPRMFSGTIDDGMRRGIPEPDWGGVVTLYGDAPQVAAFTGNRDGLTARVVLLVGGEVAFFHDRGFSVGALEQLASHLGQSVRGRQ